MSAAISLSPAQRDEPVPQRSEAHNPADLRRCALQWRLAAAA